MGINKESEVLINSTVSKNVNPDAESPVTVPVNTAIFSSDFSGIFLVSFINLGVADSSVHCFSAISCSVFKFK